MSYHDLLTKYGSEQTSTETHVHIYTIHPRKLKSSDEIEYIDKNTAGQIKRLEKLIEDLKDYRAALTARYGELLTMAYKSTLKLERYPHWKGHIEYIVTITKTMEDGTAVEELREVFPGKERRAAFSRFDELRRQRPGIEAIKDIERRSWER